MTMTIYLPFPNNLEQSAEVLDDKTLEVQIKDIILVFGEILKYKQGKRYLRHAVVEAYKDNVNFVATYGLMCINEYKYRFGKVAKDCEALLEYCVKYGIDKDVQCSFTPYYIEKRKVIKDNDAIDLLYQGKLIENWIIAKEQPVWTMRDTPEFLQLYVGAERFVQETYWRIIQRIKEM